MTSQTYHTPTLLDTARVLAGDLTGLTEAEIACYRAGEIAGLNLALRNIGGSRWRQNRIWKRIVKEVTAPDKTNASEDRDRSQDSQESSAACLAIEPRHRCDREQGHTGLHRWVERGSQR
jgi:hypothetical protein